MSPEKTRQAVAEHSVEGFQEALQNREKMLSALNRAAIIFLSRKEGAFEDAMAEGLALISEVANFDRVSLFRNTESPEGRLLSQIYRWKKSAGGTVNTLEALQNFPYTDYVPRWEAILASGEWINGPVRSMPEAEALIPLGCETLLAMPVFSGGTFWGLVLFEDLKTERLFTEYETDMLRSASFMLANMVIRNEKLAKIREADEQGRLLLHAVNRVSTIMLQADVRGFRDAVQLAMSILAGALLVDRVYIWKNSMQDGRLYASRVYGWSGPGSHGDYEQVDEGLYADVLPDWGALLPQGLCVNATLSQMNDKQRAFMAPQKVRSILLVPIFLKGRFWGFIGFTDCQRERRFSGHEESILRSASEMIAEALIRNEMEENLRTSAEQLKLALTEAQAASHAKGEFLSRMSHEMRTPLNAIIGMATIGKNADSRERKDYALGKIDEASAHLLSIVNDILDISKIEANRLELILAAFVLEDMLNRSALLVRYRIEEKRQTFSIHIDEKVPPYLVGDEQRLRQVLINLLSNAVKFTPDEGSVQLNVSLESEEASLCTLRVEVADSGIGISTEQQGKVFLAFEQEDGGTSRKFGGTGLGLAISKHIIELMGGTIWVESEKGKGARFIFTVPLKRAEERALPPSLHHDDSAAHSEYLHEEFAGKRILLVEDVDINREILASLLDGTGLIIDMAENGREAVDMVTKDTTLYDLVLMDIQMPEMDGFEATQRIRAIPFGARKSRLPIIAMTANVYQENIESCLAAGMDDHIGKPLEMEVLLKKLREYLS